MATSLGTQRHHRAVAEAGEAIGLRASFAANTAIKFAGGVSDKDARALAPDMRCKSEFIAGQRKHDDHTAFAAFVRNLTPTALSLSVPFGTFDRSPQMTTDAHRDLRERNRRRYAVSPVTAVAPAPGNTTADARPATDDDDGWSSGMRSA